MNQTNKMTSAKKSGLLSGLFFAIGMSCFYCFQFRFIVGIITGIFSGVFFGVTIYFFVSSKMVERQTEISISDNEAIIFSGPANHFLNWEGAGGKLYLLKDKLWFKSHRFNLQNHEWQLPIDQVKEIEFYNVLGFAPTGLAITTYEGKNEKFVVNNRKEWKAAIMRAKGHSA
ncbi:MAG: hypothetical protein ACXVAY_11675 [Mucilaginibacter sp.]